MWKKKTYVFKDPIEREKSYHDMDSYRFKTQVIICGNLAGQFLEAMGENLTLDNEEEVYHSFIFTKAFVISNHIDITLDKEKGPYKKTKTKTKEGVVFEITKNFTTNLKVRSEFSTELHPGTYYQTTPNFNSNLSTWLIVASSQKDEQKALVRELQENLQAGKFKIHLFHFPERFNSNHWLRSCSYFPVFDSEADIVMSRGVTDFAKSFKDLLTTEASEFKKRKIKAIAEAAKQDIQQDLENELETKADKHLNRRCVIS